jgi:hypothetical protein
LEEAHDPIAGCGYCHCKSFQDATSEYTENLLYLSDMALASVKQDLESQSSIKPLFVLEFPDGHLDVIRLAGRYVELYQYREARQKIFQAIRIMVELFGITAVVTVGDAWVGRSTAKGRQLSRQEFERISSIGNGFQVALEQGLLERVEAIVITVQTPKRMMTLMQMYQRSQDGPLILQEVHISEMDMALYHGALKMFGNQEEEEHVETGQPG